MISDADLLPGAHNEESDLRFVGVPLARLLSSFEFKRAPGKHNAPRCAFLRMMHVSVLTALDAKV